MKHLVTFMEMIYHCITVLCMTPKYCIIKISNFIILPPVYHIIHQKSLFSSYPLYITISLFIIFIIPPLTCMSPYLSSYPPYMYNIHVCPLTFHHTPPLCVCPHTFHHTPPLHVCPLYLVFPPVKADLPENYSEKAWKKLKEAIKAVHQQQPISYSLEELYQAVENMSSHKMAAKLYDSLRVELEGHVTSLSPVFREEVDDFQFLVVVDKQWRDHCQQMVSWTLYTTNTIH